MAQEVEKKQSLFSKVSSIVNAQLGDIQLPDNYSPTNQLKAAWLYLQELEDKDGKPVLESCSQSSIIQCILKMVIEGMSVTKGQCYFVAYAGQLKYVQSYSGKQAFAKRVAGVEKVIANVVYEKDAETFEYEIDAETGITKIISHKQKLENIDPKNIKGAYAIIHFQDGTKQTTIMTFSQIVQAWNQRKGNGLSPAHQNFADEMCKKTVSNRALKPWINSSDDSYLFEGKELEESNRIQISDKDIEEFEFEDAQEVKNELPEKQAKETVPSPKKEAEKVEFKPKKDDQPEKEVDLFNKPANF